MINNCETIVIRVSKDIYLDELYNIHKKAQNELLQRVDFSFDSRYELRFIINETLLNDEVIIEVKLVYTKESSKGE